MAKLKIHRWDPVVYENNIHPFPMIYIKPDKTFLDFAQENKYSVLVKIEDTGTIYDGKSMIGIVSKSADNPNCRPNFFNKTGFYTITLYARWYEYPSYDTLGTAIIQGLKGTYKIPKTQPPPFKQPVPTYNEYYDNDSNGDCNKLSTTQLGSIFIALLVFFGIVLWISMTTKKK